MPKIKKLIQSFNSGELTPLLDARIDQQKYNSGCQTMENFLPLIQGGAEKRPGTIFAGEVKDSTSKTRIIAFERSATNAYILEIGNQYIRFFKNNGRVVVGAVGDIDDWSTSTDYIVNEVREDADNAGDIYICSIAHNSGTFTTDVAAGKWLQLASDSNSQFIYEIETPYLTADLFELKFETSNDVMWITHPSYEQRKLSRFSDTNFVLSAAAHEAGPFLTENLTTTTITADNNLDVGDTVILTASAAVFIDGTTAGHEPTSVNGLPTEKAINGALFQISHIRPSVNDERSFTGADQASNANIFVFKNQTVDFITQGTWTGTLTLQRNFDLDAGGSTWETVHAVTSEDNANDRIVWTERNDNALYRIFSSLFGGVFTGTATGRVSVRSSVVNGVVRITTVASTTSATGIVEKQLVSTDATTRWSEGAWSNRNGWPTAVTISPDERLTFVANSREPLTVWASKTSVFDDFTAGANDDDALVFTLVGIGQQNQILWIVSKNVLLLGTEGGEHKLGSSDAKEPMTPSNVSAKVQSTLGSKNIQPLIVNSAVLYVQRGGRRIREMLFSFEDDNYNSDNLTDFSNHITESGLTQIDYQRAPDPVVWSTRDDGQIAVMSYERRQEIFSWARFITYTSNSTVESDFESVAVISTNTEEDQVYVIVERVINGSTVRYIEFFNTRGF